MQCNSVSWSKNKFNDEKDIMIDGMLIEAYSRADRSVFLTPYIFFIHGSQGVFLRA